MTLHLRLWRKYLTPSLCAMLATGGAAAWAEDLPSLFDANAAATTAASAPITPTAHNDGDDPPPAPPFEFSPSAPVSGRRAPIPAPRSAEPAPIAEHGLEASNPVYNLAPQETPPTTLAPPALPGEAGAPPAPIHEPLIPDPLPDDVDVNARDLPPAPALEGLRQDIPDVHISAPLPAEVPETELVQERYPNGSLKIAREVTQDGQGNFINHGSWKYYSQQGDLLAEGEYRRGVREGVWRRALQAKESPLFATPPYNQFQGPFISEVRLKDGQIDGPWIITDARGQKISEIEFAGGVRHGVASWWHNNGKKMQQITFQNGAAAEEILTWRPDGSLAAKEVYHQGRKVQSKTEYYAQNKKKSSGEVLAPRMVVVKEDDWWSAQLATFKPEGKEERHGHWTSWHPNGQEQVEGHFEYGQPHGEFVWWYANGQKSVEGAYRKGERHGLWTWWHENGLKSSMGEFIDGKPAGQWTWWSADGKVAQKADFADGVPAQALEKARLPLKASLPPQQRRK